MLLPLDCLFSAAFMLEGGKNSVPTSDASGGDAQIGAFMSRIAGIV